MSGLPPRHEPEQKAYDGQWSLHGQAMLVGWLPLDQQGPVVQPESGGLLGHVDVQGGAREHGGDKERKLTSEHGDLLRFPPTIKPLV
jgi:hypothetical protein